MTRLLETELTDKVTDRVILEAVGTIQTLVIYFTDGTLLSVTVANRAVTIELESQV